MKDREQAIEDLWIYIASHVDAHNFEKLVHDLLHEIGTSDLLRIAAVWDSE